MISGNCSVKSDCRRTIDLNVNEDTTCNVNKGDEKKSVEKTADESDWMIHDPYKHIDIDGVYGEGEREGNGTSGGSGLFNGVKSSGKHLVLDIQDIENVRMLDDLASVKAFFDFICETYDFHILHKIEHVFQPQGFSLIYMLSESHISIHTFPERKYAAVDLYTCRQYTDDSIQEEIQRMFMEFFDARRKNKIVLDRNF
jgi:S-adenosylmethionine decarboxylase